MSAIHNNDGQQHLCVINIKLYACVQKECQQYYTKKTQDNISAMSNDFLMKRVLYSHCRISRIICTVYQKRCNLKNVI